MKSSLKIFLYCLIPIFSMAQIDPTWGYVTQLQADSLKRSVLTETNDKIRMAAFRSLGFYYQDFIADSGLYFHEQQLALSKKLKMYLWQADGYSQSGYCNVALGNIMKAYEYYSEAMNLAGDKKNELDNWRPWTFSNAENGHDARIAILAMNYQMMGELWGLLGEQGKQRSYYEEAIKLGESINNCKVIFYSYTDLAKFFLPPDSAIMLTKKGLNFADAAGFSRTGSAFGNLARAYAEKRMFDSALIYAQKSIAINESINHLEWLVGSYSSVALLFRSQNNKDSSLFYAKKSLETARITGLPQDLLRAYQCLSLVNQSNNNTDSAYKYEKLSNKLNDSLKNARINSLTEYQKFSFNEHLRLKKLDEEKTAYANNLKMIGLLAVLVFLFLFLRQIQKKKSAIEKAEALHKMAELEMQSLRSQLNPHFMFNSLNSIQTLILKEDSDKSQSYLSLFARLLRMLLENAEKPFIPLQKEIEFLGLYLSLENLRVPDLQYSFSMDPDLNTEQTLIPNMILQPYVENAIWHGLSYKEKNKQLQIRINRNNGAIKYEIEDNGIGRQKAEELKSLFRKQHQSKGMELLSKRFHLLSEEYKSQIETEVKDVIKNDEVAGTLVTIKVPVQVSLTQQT